jgi:hypothetical protein
MEQNRNPKPQKILEIAASIAIKRSNSDAFEDASINQRQESSDLDSDPLRGKVRQLLEQPQKPNSGKSIFAIKSPGREGFLTYADWVKIMMRPKTPPNIPPEEDVNASNIPIVFCQPSKHKLTTHETTKDRNLSRLRSSSFDWKTPNAPRRIRLKRKY